ncbi:MAG: biotin transporter BioY [Gemmatimonadota bacterium]
MLSFDKTVRYGAYPVAVVRRRGLVWAAGAVLFAVLTAAGARLAVPLPGTAVPFTLQVLAVLLSGFLLGPFVGAASQIVYLAAGLAGVPVFYAGGGFAYLLGPTGGYLLAFPAAAAIAGAFAWRSPRVASMLLGAVLAVAMIHLGGAAWLALVVGGDAALRAGVLPFLPGDLLKVALAVLIGSRFHGRFRRTFG